MEIYQCDFVVYEKQDISLLIEVDLVVYKCIVVGFEVIFDLFILFEELVDILWEECKIWI